MSFGVCVADDKFDAAYDWCVDTFGHDNDLRWWTDIEPLYSEEFIFVHEQDATLFILKWR